jgi:hypothetical protein
MRRTVIAGLLGALLLVAPAFAQVDHLEVLQTPQLLACDSRPFFRIAVSAVDAERRPVGVPLGNGDPRALFAVSDGDRVHKTVYVEAPGSTSTTLGTYVLVLFDTSGSMNLRLPSGQSRFVAAKAAIRQSLANFADGVDFMAVVPFDSHNVAGRISSARFESTRAAVEAQIESLPQPQPDGNTALYSAVLDALPKLKEHMDTSAAVSLILFTDGENDVGHPKDDKLLLGNDGLDQVKEQAKLLRVPITTVGFGVSGNAAAQIALRGMAFPTADNYYDASTNPQLVTEIFKSTRQKMSERFTIVFGPVGERRDQLTASNLQFKVKVKAGDRLVSSRLEPTWEAPAVGAPVASTQCTAAEARAIAQLSDCKDCPAPPPGPPIRLIIFIFFAGLLAGLWFGAPRLMWPESYVPRPNLSAYVPAMPPGVPQPNMPPPRMPQQRPPQFDAPRPPVMGGAAERPRGGSTPAASSGSLPRGAQPTIVVPPRGQAGAPSSRTPPRAPEPPSRQTGDETIYQPPPKPPRLDKN